VHDRWANGIEGGATGRFAVITGCAEFPALPRSEGGPGTVWLWERSQSSHFRCGEFRQMIELLDAIVNLLNLPQMRALSVIVAVISFICSTVALWRIWRVAQAQEKHFDADQARYIQGLWQQTNANILRDPAYLEAMKELCTYKDDEEALKSYMIFNQLNPVYAAFFTYNSSKTLNNARIYKENLEFVLSAFDKSCRAFLKHTLDNRGYRKEFVADCKACLADIEEKEKSSVSRQVAASRFGGSALTSTVRP
jgi:hypothetical protein